MADICLVDANNHDVLKDEAQLRGRLCHIINSFALSGWLCHMYLYCPVRSYTIRRCYGCHCECNLMLLSFYDTWHMHCIVQEKLL